MDSMSKFELKMGENVSAEVIAGLGRSFANLSVASSDVPSTSRGQQTAAARGSAASDGYGVRDMNEKMDTLRKNNFDLRFRLFHMQQQLSQAKGEQGGHGSASETQLAQELLANMRIENSSLRQELSARKSVMVDVHDVISRWECNSQDQSKEQEELLKTLRARIDGEQMHDWNERPLSSADKRNDEISSLSEELAKRDRTIEQCDQKILELALENAVQQDRMDYMSVQLALVPVQLANKAYEVKKEKDKLASSKLRLRNATYQIRNLKRKLKKQDDTINAYRQQFLKLSCVLSQYDNQCVFTQYQFSMKMAKAAGLVAVIRSHEQPLPEETFRLNMPQYDVMASPNDTQSWKSADSGSVTSGGADAEGI